MSTLGRPQAAPKYGAEYRRLASSQYVAELLADFSALREIFRPYFAPGYTAVRSTHQMNEHGGG